MGDWNIVGLATGIFVRRWWSEWGTAPSPVVGASLALTAMVGYSRLATGTSRFLPVVRAEAAHAFDPGGLRSLLSLGMIAGSSANAALF
jgi:uncharacterized protein involved in response to NO